MKNAIVIGATSGIGRAVADVLNARGYAVGLTGRRRDRLAEARAALSDAADAEPMDVTDTEQARQRFDALADRMGGVDLVIISAGVGYTDEAASWQHTRETVATNALGFAALADAAYRHFAAQGSGHLVGITSVSAVRESGAAPAYHASKAFAARYLAGLRHRAVKAGLPITVTDVRPGFVDTAMAKGDGLFWVAPVEKAAAQIVDGVERKRAVIYVTRRWRLLAALLQSLPRWLYYRAL